MSRPSAVITPELVLRAYAAGLFPMAEGRRSSRLFWLDPEQRGILPLDHFHLPRRLARTVNNAGFQVKADQDFSSVVQGCAEPAPGREDSWINPEVERLFNSLHYLGHAHSIEVYRDGLLVGGLYGVRIGSAFFGESMFSREREASKVALVHLVVRLRRGGFTLLDTQFLTAHLRQFGAIEIPQADYKARLGLALRTLARWEPDLTSAALSEEVAAIRSSGSDD
ncbi:leucyl/phenylalanyl-tRNA--protein transferase [Roseomonas elaeocarpi]|uniref:Leucyl/phenylalanyl-tRNA--protein transferase n=1 Tax=Roseomonas elaeocarpi TaxID=907779 RepID=A0ABV6JQK5_9PROT